MIDGRAVAVPIKKKLVVNKLLQLAQAQRTFASSGRFQLVPIRSQTKKSAFLRSL
jgi:hypothetical protein